MRAVTAVVVLAACGDNHRGVCEGTAHVESRRLPLRSAFALSPSGELVIAASGGLDATSSGSGDLVVARGDVMRHHAGDQEARALAVASDDAVAVAGTFRGTLDLAGTPLAGGDDAMYAAAFAADGRLLFARSIANAQPGAIAFGTSLVAIAGRLGFGDAVDLGGGPLPPDSTFVLVVDREGRHVFSRAFSPFAALEGLDVDVTFVNDELAVAGSFVDTIDLGGCPVTSQGSTDVFVATYDRAGALRAARAFGGPRDEGRSGFDGDRVAIAPHADGFVVTGAFTGPLDFGDGPHAPADDLQDVFAVSLTRDLALRWSRVFVNVGYQASGAVSSHGGTLAIAGTSGSGFDPAAPFACGIRTTDNNDVLHAAVTTLDANGRATWQACFPSEFGAHRFVFVDPTDEDELVLGGIVDGRIELADGALEANGAPLGTFVARVRRTGCR